MKSTSHASPLTLPTASRRHVSLKHLSLQQLSLQQRLIVSFAIALIPLAVLLWQGHTVFQRITVMAQTEAQAAMREARQVENLDRLAVDSERALRQHAVVTSDNTLTQSQQALQEYRQAVSAACLLMGGETATHCSSHLQLIDAQLAAIGTSNRAPNPNTLTSDLPQLRQHQSELTEHIWRQLNQRLEAQGEIIQQEQQALYWQTLTLVLLTAVMVVGSSRRIAAPIQRLDRMIRSLGQPGATPDHNGIQGPRELNELGERLTWLSGRLQQLEALRLALLRHAAHELKTPLASIKEGCSLLEEGITGPLTGPQREVVALLSGSTDRLAQLTEQLLDYNQWLQQTEVRRQTLSPSALINDTLSQHQLALHQRGMTVQVVCTVDRLHTDPTLFQRMLDNLITNALAYGADAGQIHIRLEHQSPWVVLEVANTGPAIPAHLHQSIFEPFQRGDAPRQDSLQSSGLGLSIVTDCARLLEGRAGLAERTGYDVCVRIQLPVREANA